MGPDSSITSLSMTSARLVHLPALTASQGPLFFARNPSLFSQGNGQGNTFRTAARERVAPLLLHYRDSYWGLCCLSPCLGCSSRDGTIFPNAGNSLRIQRERQPGESSGCGSSKRFLRALQAAANTTAASRHLHTGFGSAQGTKLRETPSSAGFTRTDAETTAPKSEYRRSSHFYLLPTSGPYTVKNTSQGGKDVQILSVINRRVAHTNAVRKRSSYITTPLRKGEAVSDQSSPSPQLLVSVAGLEEQKCPLICSVTTLTFPESLLSILLVGAAYFSLQTLLWSIYYTDLTPNCSLHR